MQHSTTKDDYYKDYRITRGSIIIANAYSIHMDSEKFKAADIFEPARYIYYPHSATHAVNLKNPDERDHFAYGAGCRVCAGIHVAEVNLFITLSNMLWGFDIANAKTKNGKTIPISTLG
jgi:cytochrome P450